MTSQDHERERDETHSYWYIPLTLRVDYSLLIMVASGDDSPLRQGTVIGSRLVFGGYRGVRWWSPSSRLTFEGLYIWDFSALESREDGPQGAHTTLGVLCGAPEHVLVL